MEMQVFAMMMVWSLITSQACLRTCHEIPVVPGADVDEASMSSCLSSLAVKGSKVRVGVGGGSSCCDTWTRPVSCTKKRSARIHAIVSGSKVRLPSWSRSAAISEERRPCLHLATSQMLPLATTLSAHSRLAFRVTRVNSFHRVVVSSCGACRAPAAQRSAATFEHALFHHALLHEGGCFLWLKCCSVAVCMAF